LLRYEGVAKFRIYHAMAHAMSRSKWSVVRRTSSSLSDVVARVGPQLADEVRVAQL
jgi:hypothetical protein